MKFALFSLAAVSIAAVASPAAADVGGSWHVVGKVSSFAFTLNCDFKPDGARLGGVCLDASTNDPKVSAGKSHTITAGHIDGTRVGWTYQSSFLLTKFDVTYDGVQSGGQMSGTIRVQGHEGAFTATRQ